MKKIYLNLKTETMKNVSRKMINSLMGLSFALLLTAPNTGFSNALRFNSMVTTQLGTSTGTIQFTVQWENSWRISTSPNNWDAAWIFFKFRTCGVAQSTPWTHGLVSTTLADHIFPAAVEPMTTTAPAGVSTAGAIDGSAGTTANTNHGIMIRQAVALTYPTTGPHTITIRFTNMPLLGVATDFKIFGVEMVYIPEGIYFLGDNSGNGVFNNTGTTTSPWNPYTISSEAVQTIQQGNSYALLNGPFPTTALGTPGNITSSLIYSVGLSAGFPKGFQGFYIMKYEVSSEQYSEFLNTLPDAAAAALYAHQTFNNTLPVNNLRNRLIAGGVAPNVYTTTRPDRAQNYIFWRNCGAYLDWACLRPMSEMEYEKACRGTVSFVTGEFAWGTNTYNSGNNITATVPVENGTERIDLPVDANCNFVTAASFYLTGGDAGAGATTTEGPLRVGIFAKPTSNSRLLTGASFYGVMELSGNLSEWVVPVSLCHTNITNYSGGAGVTNAWNPATAVSATPAVRTDGPCSGTQAGPCNFTRIWGNGDVDAATGNHDVNGWPNGHYVAATSFNNPYITPVLLGIIAGGAIVSTKGGNWGETAATTATNFTVSNRQQVYAGGSNGPPSASTTDNTKGGGQGGRGVR